MSIESEENPEPKCPEGFPPEFWVKLDASGRARIIELEKLMSESEVPSERDDWVQFVLSLDEDIGLIIETLDAAGVRFGMIGSKGIGWFELSVKDYERALLCLQDEPRLVGRYIDMQRCSVGQEIYEVSRIPSRRANDGC